jgi:hypothetical protein
MMIPEAWENHAEMDPARGPSTSSTPPDGAVGRAGRRRASPTARSSARCSTATACARAASGSPTTASSCWPPRSACSTSTRRGSSARAGCSRAGCSSWTPPRAASSRTTRSRPSSPPSTPTTSGCTPASCTSTTCPSASTSCTRTPRCPPPADLRLHRGGAADPARADGAHGRRADRVDGHRHAHRGAVGAAAAALRLLQPAVRAGDQPAAGRDPRGARDLAGEPRSARGQPARRRRRRTAASSCCRSR